MTPKERKQFKADKAVLGSSLFRRDNAKDARERAQLEQEISRVVLRGTHTAADGASVKKIAELASGLRELVKAGKYGDDTPAEAIAKAGKLRGIDVSDVPDKVKKRLAKLT